jgi:hypothetical protein
MPTVLSFFGTNSINPKGAISKNHLISSPNGIFLAIAK